MTTDMSPSGLEHQFQKLICELFPEIYRDTAQPLLRKLGKAFGLLFEGTFLFPIQRWHFKKYVRLVQDFADYIKDIPENQICPIAPQIGFPVLERLTYCDEDISKLFAKLLVTAASQERTHLAHPRFVQIIDALSSDEARLLVYLADIDYIPYLTVGEEIDVRRGEFKPLTPKLTALERCVEFKFPNNITLYLDNLLSLGILVGGTFSIYFAPTNDVYDSLSSLHQETIKRLEAEYHGNARRLILKGSYEVTTFGRMFIRACAAVPDCHTRSHREGA
jgi:hypothetical protein